MRFPGPITTILGLICLAVAGCGSSSPTAATSTDSTTTQTGDTVHIVMKSLAFNPVLVRATVGQKVLWSNIDNAPHNVTYVSGPRFRSSNTLNRGHDYEIALTKAGTIQYYCSIHPWMKATIVVTP